MQDNEIALFNACTDLVSLRKSEAFPRHLLGTKQAGEWICVRDCCQEIGVAPGDLGPALFATWLPDPLGHNAYAVVMFYDDESKWSMAAHYHRGRLMGSASPNQAFQPVGADNSASPGSTTSQVSAPAAELYTPRGQD